MAWYNLLSSKGAKQETGRTGTEIYWGYLKNDELGEIP